MRKIVRGGFAAFAISASVLTATSVSAAAAAPHVVVHSVADCTSPSTSCSDIYYHA